MERKLKILKAVLLLRMVNRNHTKENQIAMVDKHYSDWEIDEWIDYLKNPEYMEPEERYPSSTKHDYSRHIPGMLRACVSATVSNL